jgi:murein DD-endopeptidase MepM/ murein hydrolase activator NlpD
MTVLRPLRALASLLVLVSLAVVPATAGAQTKDDVDRTAEARDQAYEALVSANERLDAALEDYQLINAELVDLTWRIEQLFVRIEDYEADVKELRGKARSLVINAYMSGGSADLVEVAFSAESIQDVLTGQVLMARAAEADVAQLDRLGAVSRELDRLKADLGVKEERVAVLTEQAMAAVAEMDAAQQDAAEVYQEADQEAREAYAQWQAEIRRQKLAELARKQGAAGGLSNDATPGFVCPVSGGAAFINDWGFPRSGGRRHEGTDMFAARGTPVVAVGDGTVRYDTNSLGGTVAWVVTNYGISFYYAHLDGYAGGISSGQRVSGGTTIGYVGNSGNAIGTSPHLHFGVYLSSGAVNPYPTLTRHNC